MKIVTPGRDLWWRCLSR